MLPDAVRSRMLCLDLVQRQSIDPWIRPFLLELGIAVEMPIPMYCDNQAAIFIANNLTFHERTKYIEVNCHYVRDMVMKGVISTPYTQSSEQLANIFTKRLSARVF